MTAKEYLSQLITMDNAINRKQQRLMTLRDVAMNTTPNYSGETVQHTRNKNCLLYTSPSPRDKKQSRMPSSA